MILTGRSPIFTTHSRQWVSLPSIFLLLTALASTTALASEFELSRIAREISIASNYLAQDLKYSRGFGSVGQRADRLARDSAQLVDAISRRRSASTIRSQYADVSERFSDLEDAFFRASRNYSNGQVYDQVNMISALFSDLSSVYYYSPVYNNRTSVVTFVGAGSGFVQRRMPDVFLKQRGRGSRHNGRNLGAPEHSRLRQRENTHAGAAAERVQSVEGRHRTGQRIIRSRPNRSLSTRRRGRSY